jgi:signal peptidase I
MQEILDLGAILTLIPFYFIWSAIMGLLFKKAGRNFWLGFVPIYCWVVWLDIIKKPTWWLAMLFIPIVNFFYSVGMVIEFLHGLGKHKFYQHVMGVVFGVFYLPYLALNKDVKFTPPEKQKRPKKSSIREWADAIVFAVFAATFIRMFTIEAYTIPTSSMEKSC